MRKASIEEMRRKKSPVMALIDSMGMSELLNAENARDLNDISREEQKRVRDLIEDHQEEVDSMMMDEFNKFIHDAIKGEIKGKEEKSQ